MTVLKMEKWLKRDGWAVVHVNRQYTATKPGVHSRIEFLPNGEDRPDQDAVCLRVIRDGERDEIQSDYCAGTFCDSLARAERLAERV